MMYVMIALGAIGGALTRFTVSRYLNPIVINFPLGTLLVNLVGGFCMGFFIGLIQGYMDVPKPVRLGVTSGFLGSLSSFSAFSIEAIEQFVQGNLGWGTLIIIAQLGGVLLATGVGLFAAKSLY